MNASAKNAHAHVVSTMNVLTLIMSALARLEEVSSFENKRYFLNQELKDDILTAAF